MTFADPLVAHMCHSLVDIGNDITIVKHNTLDGSGESNKWAPFWHPIGNRRCNFVRVGLRLLA